jgi:hypothetical protein
MPQWRQGRLCLVLRMSTVFWTATLNCYSEVCNSEDLEPCPKVNDAFEKLVGLCGQCPNEDVVAQVCHSRLSHALSVLCFSVNDLGRRY